MCSSHVILLYKSATRESWELVLRLAETQRGLVTRAQLHECGLSSRVLRLMTLDGSLRIVRPGVYAVAGRAPSRWELAVADRPHWRSRTQPCHTGRRPRSTACPDCVAPPRPEISVPASRHPEFSDAVVHRVAQLDQYDIERRSGVGVTTPPRTLVDLAARLTTDLLGRVIDEGTIARRWTVAGLMACTDRLSTPGRRGIRTLRQLLADRADEPRAESMLELRMIRILAPFAPFETQYELVLDGKLLRLDIAWPWWRVAAEVDGWGVRSRSRTKFVEDRYRMNLLEANDWRVAHLTSAMDASMVLRDVGRLLPI